MCVSVQVIKLDTENRQVGLSIKQLLADPIMQTLDTVRTPHARSRVPVFPSLLRFARNEREGRKHSSCELGCHLFRLRRCSQLMAQKQSALPP